MTKKDVSKWIWNDNARTIEGQLQYAIACEVEGYLNGINDCGLNDYPKMTREEWINYAVKGIKMCASEYFNINGLDYRHLMFNGNKKIQETAETYVDNYRPIQEYIAK